jgi:hypothetical protein
VRDCSYDAAEENEVSFREGERIVEIEAVSDDWWQGKLADGSVGLFPGMFLLIPALGTLTEIPSDVANYVEVQQ